MPSVGLDLRALDPQFKAHFGRGTGRYVAKLTEELFRYGANDSINWNFTGLSYSDLHPNNLLSTLIKCSPVGRVTLETQVLLPKRLAAQNVELLHFFSHGDAPIRLKVPYIVTVLDLIPLKFSHLYKSPSNSWRFRLARHLELGAIRNATAIIAISEATKRDIIEILGISPEIIHVTPLAVDGTFRARSTEPDAANKQKNTAKVSLGLPSQRPVLLYVGGIDARKNISFLLQCFSNVLSNSRPQLNPVLALVGSISKDKNYPAIKSEIARLGLENDVVELGFVSDGELVNAYHAADLFVFPSLYEGFGFPVLEAMSCAVPVVAGRNSSIPEVADSSALLLPDSDIEIWSREIVDLLSSTERLARFANLGMEQAKKFSWQRTAEQTVKVYSQVLGYKEKNKKNGENFKISASGL